MKESWGTLFTGLAMFFKDADWKLDEDEADVLTERSMALANTLDKKTLAGIEKKYGKYVPAVSLVVAVGVITGPRLKKTLNRKKPAHVVPVPQQEAQSGSASPAPAQPRTEPTAGPVDAVAGSIRPEPQINPSPIVIARSIRFEDGAGLNLVDDG